ncbi:sodium- and chloride-dependent glycine transporter 1-like isoform X3 [Biomphalaria glabrata]|uniref:Transporter n=1 Tax=Biomphalaria glabrata TaxID=6526 RepID=A0A9W3BIP6_BIOGL|nr:sodium- and chloride-dependent glycine transporter 1-like isoform X3 [Biomphalaria glabrata]
MAATSGRSHLYPNVLNRENGTKTINGENDNEARMDLLRNVVIDHHRNNVKQRHKSGDLTPNDAGPIDGSVNKSAVPWYKKDFTENSLEDDVNKSQNSWSAADQQLAQDVSSTAVLTSRVGEEIEDLEITEIDRGNWSGRFDFLMSLLGYSVGLGNVWRFPYLAYSNGGGAFLFPFIIMFILLGFPLMFLELSFGQFAALGPAAIFDRICPLLNGIGHAMVCVSCMVAFYYTVIIGWAFLYMFKSFASELPWERCHKDWASERCYSHKDAADCTATNGSVYYLQNCFNKTEVERLNISSLAHNKSDRAPPAQDYFERDILGVTESIEDIGGLQWQIVLCLLLTWTLTFLSLSKGVKSVGKVVYFTALFPYVVLTILFFRGVTLDGAKDGIIYYLTPKFDKLIVAETWVKAAVQIFFALSPAWGGLITLSSYNKFHNNCFKDSLIVGVGNVCTSIYAGFVIFSIVGYLAKELETPIDTVVDEGPGLAFIVFPDVVTRLPIPPLWSFLFFFMLITLGMGSEFALLETVMTAVQDTYPPLRQKKVFVVLGVCVFGFLGGLVVCTEGGMYVLQLMDTYSASFAVFIMAILECLIIGWIYGADRFLRDIETMIGQRSKFWHYFFIFFWKFLTPATLIFLLLFNLVDYKRMSYKKKPYPVWAELLGWFMTFIPVLVIICMGIWRFYRSPKEKTFVMKLKKMLHDTPKWGPASKIPRSDSSLDIEGGKSRIVTNPGFTTTGNETRI